MTEHRKRDLAALAILAAIPTLLFVDVLAGTGVLYIRDVGLYHFPQKKILYDIVASGEFPFWNPFYSAGQPLAANPAHEVFYPLTWLALLPGLVYGLQLLALVHVYIATFAVYALLRSMAATRAAAVIGGLSFGLGGLALSGLDLFPLLFSAAWMPVTCLFTRRYLRERAPRDFALAAIAFAMQLLAAEPVTVLQTGLLLGLYALLRSGERTARRVLADIAMVGAISIAALFVSAVQTLPGIDHAADSVRADGFELAAVGDWSTPPLRFLETIFPDLFGAPRADTPRPYWGTTLYTRHGPFLGGIYSGLLIGALVLAGAAARIRGTRLYLAVAAVSILLAIGSHTPLLRVLYEAGLLRSIRYPEKFVMMGILASVIFGARAFDELLAGNARVRRVTIAIASITAAIGVICAAITSLPDAGELLRRLWSLKFEVTADDVAFARAGWVAAALRGLVLAILCVAVTRMRRHAAIALFGAFAAVDLGTQVPKLAPRAPVAFYTEPPVTVRELAPNRGEYRIFHIGDWTSKAQRRQPYTARRAHFFLLQRNALIARSPAAWGIRTAIDNDFDQTSLAVSEEFALAAWDLKETSSRWLDYVTAMSNVRYLAVFRNFEQAVAHDGRDARYLRPIRFVEGRPHPRYYFATQLATARDRAEFVREVASHRYDPTVAFVRSGQFTPASGRVLRWTETANTAAIDVYAEGTAFLVMSVTPHKYWIVTIDGVEVPAVVTNLGYQGVVVPRGRHVVQMRYHNPLIAAGAAVSIATLLVLLFAGWRSRRAITMRDL